MKKSTLILIFVFLQILLIARQNEGRIALIIANSDYELFPLKNAVNNAKSLKLELEKLDFEVFLYTNLNYKEMRQAIRKFGDTLSTINGAGLFYYAGRGVQSKGQNFLIPIAANIEAERDIEIEAVDLKLIFSDLKRDADYLNIVILDVPPLNPYRRFMANNTSNGFAFVSPPANTIIVFSSVPNSVPSDREFDEQIYIKELINAIRIPNIRIYEVFKEVRRNMYTKTDGLQIPWDNSSFEGEFYFLKK